MIYASVVLTQKTRSVIDILKDAKENLVGKDNESFILSGIVQAFEFDRCLLPRVIATKPDFAELFDSNVFNDEEGDAEYTDIEGILSAANETSASRIPKQTFHKKWEDISRARELAVAKLKKRGH